MALIGGIFKSNMRDDIAKAVHQSERPGGGVFVRAEKRTECGAVAIRSGRGFQREEALPLLALAGNSSPEYFPAR